ncbi:MAG: OmpH family outer membrane protein [Acidobacteria bacterium]|nr:OmpH family outer membrane protein [Acidobacteriota bacterium]
MTRLTVAAAFSVMMLSGVAFAQAPPAVSAPPAPAPAPLRMAFLDLQRIAAESNEGKAANGRVQAVTQRKGAELQEKTKALTSNQQKLAQGGAVLNEAARAQAQKEIDRLTIEIDRFQQDANAEVQEMQQALQNEFQEKLRPIVDGLVRELSIGLLFSVGDAGALYVDPSLDVTAEVIKRFDAAKPAVAVKPAAPATAKPAAAAGTKPPAPPTPPATAPPATQKPAAPAPSPTPAKP